MYENKRTKSFKMNYYDNSKWVEIFVSIHKEQLRIQNIIEIRPNMLNEIETICKKIFRRIGER